MANGRTKTASFGPSFLEAILLFCAFAVVAWILFRFTAPSQTYEEKRAQARRDKVAAINAEAEQKLYGAPKWIDQAKGTVQLPIDVAMDLVVNEYQSKPVQPSQVKVDNPYPVGLRPAVAAPAATGTAAVTGTAAPATTGTAAPATSGTVKQAAADGTDGTYGTNRTYKASTAFWQKKAGLTQRFCDPCRGRVAFLSYPGVSLRSTPGYRSMNPLGSVWDNSLNQETSAKGKM